MGRRDVVRALAKTAAATAFGGPLAGAGAGVNEAIDLMAGWLGRRERDVYEAAVARVESDLERFARGEGLAAPLVNQALEQAQALIARRGATLAEMNRLGLDPERVARAVVGRGAKDIAELDEGARELCRAAIDAVYAALLADVSALPGLETAFKRAVLERLELVPSLPGAVADAVQSTAAFAVVRDPVRCWRADLFAPSALLRAEFAIVPLQGRARELADLEQWCGDGRPLAVRLYTGAGGMGKTRLMIELIGRLAQDGWRAGFVASDVDGARSLSWLMRETPKLLLVVDYAETRRRQVGAIVRKALEDAGATVRVVLLARARADWWRDLLTQGGGVGDLLAGPAAVVCPLGPVASGEPERLAAFAGAAERFAARLGRSAPAAMDRHLGAEHFERVLFIHLAALAAVEGEPDESERGLLDFALRREQGFWDEGVRAAGMDLLAGRTIAQAAAVATLAGVADSREQAIDLLAGAPLLADQPAAVVERVAELLHRLYPGEHWLQGVQPDLLGEHLIGRALENDVGLLGVFAGAR